MPSVKGDRTVVSQVTSRETGLSTKFLLRFHGTKSKKAAEYHIEMNWGAISYCYEAKEYTVMPAAENDQLFC